MVPSKLFLASGEAFSGLSPAWQVGAFLGEVVFTTGMSGYVEALTDPSFAGQILTFTFPLIGNYGVPERSLWESEKVQVSGLILGTLSPFTSHWSAEDSLLNWLRKEKIPLIMGIDTRALTKQLRTKGVVLGAISTDPYSPQEFPDPTDLVQKVSPAQVSYYGSGPKKVIAVDCGMKENILRTFARFPFLQVERVPYNYDYSEEPFDALFLSNGPGNPVHCSETIAILQKALQREKPTFGICLGAQLLALAIGAKTFKLKFGHRGQNHPCLNLEEKRAILTSQNHGYAIEEESLPQSWKVTFRSLNDGSVEGIAHRELPFTAVQFHPESSPGPCDADYLLEQFCESLA